MRANTRGRWRGPALALAVALLGSRAAGQDRAASALNPDVAPVVWASPLAGGAIDAAFLVPGDGLPDVHALGARVELNADTVSFPLEASTVASAETGDWIGRAERLDRDVLVVSGMDLHAAPGVLRSRWVTHVRDGGGLVVVRYARGSEVDLAAALPDLDPEPVDAGLLRGMGARLLSDFRAGYDRVTAYRAGEGRVVEIVYWNARPRGHALLPATDVDALDAPTAIENYFAMWARILRWSAGRDTKVRIARLENRAPEGPNPIDTPPQLPRQFIQRLRDASYNPVMHAFTLVLDRPAPSRYTVRVNMRYPLRGVQWSYTADELLPKGAQRFDLGVPSGLGDYFIDCWLMDRSDVVDWYSEAVHVDGWPELRNVSFSKQVVKTNDRVEVSFDVRKNLSQPQPATAFVFATDAYGRRIADRRVPVDREGGSITVELPLVDLIAPYLKIELFVTGVRATQLNWLLKERSAYAFAHVVVDAPLTGAFQLITDAPAGGSPWARSHRRRLASEGVDLIYPRGTPVSVGTIAADGLREVAPLQVGDTAVCVPDLGPTSPEGYRLRTEARAFEFATPGLYFLADSLEDGFADPLVSPACRATFGDWLRKRYRSLADLNARWHTSAESWEEATEQAATRSAFNLAMHSDIFEFRAATLDSYREAAESVLRKIRSDARLGLALRSLAETPSGDSFRFLVLDEGDADSTPLEIARGSDTFGVLRTETPEGHAAESRARWLPWYTALQGLDALWLHGNASSGDPLIANTVDTTAAATLFLSLNTLRSGYAALFQRAHANAPDASDGEWISIPSDFEGSTYAFSFGKARVYAFLQSPDARSRSQTVACRAADGEHVYAPLVDPGEPRGGAKAKLGPGDVACFARLPYEVSRVVLEAPSDIGQGKRLSIGLTVKTRGDLPGEHVLHLQFFGPDGEELRYYAQSIVAKAGAVETYLPLAFDEDAGPHRLVVRDALTGVTGEATINVVATNG